MFPTNLALRLGVRLSTDIKQVGKHPSKQPKSNITLHNPRQHANVMCEVGLMVAVWDGVKSHVNPCQVCTVPSCAQSRTLFAAERWVALFTVHRNLHSNSSSLHTCVAMHVHLHQKCQLWQQPGQSCTRAGAYEHNILIPLLGTGNQCIPLAGPMLTWLSMKQEGVHKVLQSVNWNGTVGCKQCCWQQAGTVLCCTTQVTMIS